MGLFWFFIGAVVGFFVAWYYLSQQCRTRLAERDEDIARLRSQLADAKLVKDENAPQPAAIAAVAPKPAVEGSDPPAPIDALDPQEQLSDEDEDSLLMAPGLNVEPDDLTRIKGIGQVLQTKLNALGIVTFQQIADFTPADIERVNEELDFPGRIERERWVEQARTHAEKGAARD